MKWMRTQGTLQQQMGRIQQHYGDMRAKGVKKGRTVVKRTQPENGEKDGTKP